MGMDKVAALCRGTATPQQWSTPMRRREVGILAVAALCALATLPAAAQHKSLKEQVVGTWHIVSVEEVYSDGHKETPWGPNMKGAAGSGADGGRLLRHVQRG